MKKIKIQENFTDFYLSEKENIQPTLMAHIINSEYTSRYFKNNENVNENIKEDIVNFVKHFKKDNETIFYSLKDLPIFKFYDTIVVDKIKNSRIKINSELTVQEMILASQLSNKIFDIKKDFIYSITMDDKTFSNYASSQQQLENELKVLLHNKKGIIIFYFSCNNKKYGFGFSVFKKYFEEISPKTLKKYCNEKDIIFTTFQKFLNIKECN